MQCYKQCYKRAFVFVQPFLRNYPINLTPFWPQKRMTVRSGHFLHFLNTRFNGQMLVFQNPHFMLRIPIYFLMVFYVVRVVNFSETWPVLVLLGHLVRYLYVGISPRRVNRFLICLLIWTQLEPYLNPCKWRFVSFSRFWEIGQDTYLHFHQFVSGTFRVATY